MRHCVLMLICAILGVSVGCSNQPAPDPVPEDSPSMSLTEAHEKHSPQWMQLDGVVGTYEGRTPEGEPCIKVMVKELSEELERTIPDRVEGYPVLILPTGEIRPRNDS